MCCGNRDKSSRRLSLLTKFCTGPKAYNEMLAVLCAVPNRMKILEKTLFVFSLPSPFRLIDYQMITYLPWNVSERCLSQEALEHSD